MSNNNNKYDFEETLKKINKKIKEVLNKIESRIIEQEYETKKFNELILKELKELLLKYDIEYKIVSIV